MLGRLRTIVLVAAAAMSVACGAPDSFEGLTGGSKEDASLTAPRPMSPLSVTMVSTSRPRMKWELFGTATGAVVELCKTRDFAAGTVKRFEADGRELVVPEDLEPGIWFWRLTARGKGTVGTATSPVWEVLVRGPAARGSSDVPFGSLADIDGDGHPDLITGGDVPVSADGKLLGSELLVFTAGPDGALTTDNPQERFIPTETDTRDRHPNAVAAGIDFDGDGFPDLAYSSLDTIDPESGLEWFSVWTEGGGKWDPTGPGTVFQARLPLYPGSSPNVTEAGDVDGDGYGDVLASDWSLAYVAMGSKAGIRANMSVGWLTMIAAPGSAARAIRSAFDLDGDGLSDVVFGPAFPAPPGNASVKSLSTGGSKVPGGESSPGGYDEPRTASVALATDLRGINAKYLSFAGSGDVQARTFTSGDFDGDGVPDLAAVAPMNGATNVCVWFGSRDKGFVPGPCTAGLPGDAELGASITAADIEGDGKDEILATVKKEGASEVRVVHVGDTTADVAPIGTRGFGTRLTTVWPGRPGKARWAAIGDDGDTVAVFEAGALSQAVKRPRFVRENFGRALR